MSCVLRVTCGNWRSDWRKMTVTNFGMMRPCFTGYPFQGKPSSVGPWPILERLRKTKRNSVVSKNAVALELLIGVEAQTSEQL